MSHEPTGDARAKPDLEEAKERARDAARSAVGEGKEKLEEQSEAAAARVDDVADAIGSAASRLGELEHKGLAEYANRMASALSDMSEKLRDKSVDELAHDVSDAARSNPALFLLGSVAVGLGLSRFAKATRSRRDVGDSVGNSEAARDDQWHEPGSGEFRNGEFGPEDARGQSSSVGNQTAPGANGGSGL